MEVSLNVLPLDIKKMIMIKLDYAKFLFLSEQFNVNIDDDYAKFVMQNYGYKDINIYNYNENFYVKKLQKFIKSRILYLSDTEIMPEDKYDSEYDKEVYRRIKNDEISLQIYAKEPQKYSAVINIKRPEQLKIIKEISDSSSGILWIGFVDSYFQGYDMGYKFNDKLSSNNLPKATFDIILNKSYNNNVDNLPLTIRKIHFGSSFNKPIDHLPSSIIEFNLRNGKK